MAGLVQTDQTLNPAGGDEPGAYTKEGRITVLRTSAFSTGTSAARDKWRENVILN